MVTFETGVHEMIRHEYTKPSDNMAQYTADQCGRQEVTLDWYWQYGVIFDLAFFRWIDGQAEMNLDPWRFHMDLPIDLEDAKERKWRIFVQKKDLERIPMMIEQG